MCAKHCIVLWSLTSRVQLVEEMEWIAMVFAQGRLHRPVCMVYYLRLPG